MLSQRKDAHEHFIVRHYTYQDLSEFAIEVRCDPLTMMKGLGDTSSPSSFVMYTYGDILCEDLILVKFPTWSLCYANELVKV